MKINILINQNTSGSQERTSNGLAERQIVKAQHRTVNV